MFNIFNSTVFIEIGEAIGDVGHKILRSRGSAGELVERLFRRRLGECEGLALPFEVMRRVQCDGSAIEAEFRVLDEGGTDEHRGLSEQSSG